MLKVILKCSFQPAHLAFILHLLGWICCKPSAFLQLYLSLTCWKSINYTTSPWHHRANTSCSWPYVCVSSLDWINFRCGVCPGLLQRVCCDFEPLLLLFFFLQPPSHPSLLLHLPEGLLSQHAIFQHPTHEELSRAHTLTHTHTYASAHASKQSYPMRFLLSDGMPEEIHLYIHAPSVSLCSLYPCPEGSSQTEGS